MASGFSPGLKVRRIVGVIVFLSHYPEDVTDVRDGMSQRIAAIDSIFRDVERVYLSIDFRRNKRHRVRTNGRVRVDSLNWFLHHGYIVQCLRRARWVYAHSLHNAIYALPYFKYLRDKLIVDLHGIVPEETLFLGKPNWARVLGLVERSAINNSRLIVVVTQRMADHLLRKYSGRINPARIFLLPNVEFGQETTQRLSSEPRMPDKVRLIYAGTVGNWQKTDLMLQTLDRITSLHPRLTASLYVHQASVTQLQEGLMRLGLNGRVIVGSLRHNEILKEYAKMDAGFVLRDDILLNQVAMPTKLAEYMSHGVVPIVLSPDLGDFMRWGYRYLTIEDLFNADKLNPAPLHEMRVANWRIMAQISTQAAEAKKTLKSVING